MDDNKYFIDESNISEKSAFTNEPSSDITPVHLLSLAKWILTIIAMMYALAGLTEIYFPANHVFEACKITLPSIATLVIGYYFGSAK